MLVRNGSADPLLIGASQISRAAFLRPQLVGCLRCLVDVMKATTTLAKTVVCSSTLLSRPSAD